MKREFTLRQILSVATGILCCDIKDLLNLFDFMVGEPIQIQQVPRVNDEVLPYIHEQLPFTKYITKKQILAGADGFGGDETAVKEARQMWIIKNIEQLEEKYGKVHELHPIHFEDHEHLTLEEDLRRLGFKGEIINFDLESGPDEI